MLNLSSTLIAEKNKLSSNSAWIALLEIIVPTYGTIRICKNNVDIVFGGETYTAFPVEIDTSSWTSKGDIPTLGIRVSNIANTFNQILREYNAGIGGEVIFTLVSSEHLTEDYAELQRTFTILEASVDNYWVNWTLGSSNPLRQRFPLFTYMAHYCNWVQHFKGPECKFSGSAIVKTITNPVTKFFDDFGTLDANWTNYSGAGLASVLSEFGTTYLRLGANDFTSDGQVWLIHDVNIAFNPTKMYKVSCRFRRTSGSGKCYIGVAGVAADGATLVNVNGLDELSSHYYCAASDVYAVSTWVEYVGYFRGTASPGFAEASPNYSAAAKLHTDVAYFRPLILANFLNKNGVSGVDYFKIEEFDTDGIDNDTCNGTWTQCQAYSNTANFGGFPGLYNPEVRIV